MKRYLFLLSSLFFLGGIFIASGNSNVLSASSYCTEGKVCSPSFNFEGSDQSKYKPAEPNKYCNDRQCITKWLKQSNLPPGKNGFCVGGICLNKFNYLGQHPLAPLLNFTINDQKGIVWIPADSEIMLRWNISPKAKEVSLSCSGYCPDNLNDINNAIKTGSTRRGAVNVPWNTAESTWTLHAVRDSATISETITVIPRYNDSTEWSRVAPPNGKYLQRNNDGLWDYAIERVFHSSSQQRLGYITYGWSPLSYKKFCNRHDSDPKCEGTAYSANRDYCNSRKKVCIEEGFTPDPLPDDYGWDAKVFSFMDLDSYNAALEKVLRGPGIITNGEKITTQHEFEHYFGLPPCVSKNYNSNRLELLSDISFGSNATLNPDYKCGTTQKICTDYAPICIKGGLFDTETEDLQNNWKGKPSGPFNRWCKITGLKARIVHCNGKDDGEIQWAEPGNFLTNKNVQLASQIFMTALGAFLAPVAQKSPEWKLLKPSPRDIPPDDKKDFEIIIAPPSDNRPQELLVAIGPPKGQEPEVRELMIRVDEEDARKGGTTRVSDTQVVSNIGNLPLSFARDIIRKCGFPPPPGCREEGAANAPRIRWFPASQSPLQGY